MTIPTFEGGVTFETILPVKDSPTIKEYIPSVSQFTEVVKGILVRKESSSKEMPQGELIQQPQVVRLLLSKFEPSFAQYAVLSFIGNYKSEGTVAPKVQKEELPSQTDEVAPKGEKSLGIDLGHIEVFKPEQGQTAYREASLNEKPGETQNQKPEILNNVQENEKTLSPLFGKTETIRSPVKEESLEKQLEMLSGGQEKNEQELVATGISFTVKESLDQNSEEILSVVSIPETPDKEHFSSPEENVPIQQKIPSQGDPSTPLSQNAEARLFRRDERSMEKQTPEALDLEADLKEIQAKPQHPFLEERSHQHEAGRHHQRLQMIENYNVSGIVLPWLEQILLERLYLESHRNKSQGREGKALQHPHKLVDILFMILSSLLAGAKNIPEVINFIHGREQWLTIVLALRHGLPPRQLFFWFLSAINVEQFKETIQEWLKQVQGLATSIPILNDIELVQTALGFVIGKRKHQESDGDQRAMEAIVEGFRWEKNVAMIRSDVPISRVRHRIQKKSGHSIAEVAEELEIPQDAMLHESYLEGHERILIREWLNQEAQETNLQMVSEFFEPGRVTTIESFYISDLESPADALFDLSRLQRPYTKRFEWSIQLALHFPSIERAHKHAQEAFFLFKDYANAIFRANKEKLSTQEQIKKAFKDSHYLLQLLKNASFG